MSQIYDCNIVVDVRMYNNTGIGTYIRNLTQQFTQQSINREFLLLTGSDILVPGFKAKKTPYKIYGLAEQTLLPFSIRNETLLHSPHYNAPVLFPGKLVVTIHDLNHLTFYDQLPTLLHKMYAKIMMGMVVKRADAIMTDSDWTRKDLCQRWPQAGPKTKTVYCGVPAQVDMPDAQKVLDGYAIDRPYFLYVGLLKRHKNLNRLVEAFGKAQEKLKGEHLLVIAGDASSDDANLKQYVDGCPHKHLVRMTGFVPGGDLTALYGRASAFVFPSTAEGFGLPPLEAMTYGTPVLSSNASCLPEVLKDAPMYFDPSDPIDIADCMVRSVSDTKWRQEAGARGKNVAAGYRWEDTARECLMIYESLCGRKL